MKRAVVLLSGGLDSTTVLGSVIADGWTAYALSCDYGQRQRIELERAAAIARALGVAEHRILKVNLAEFAASALTGVGPVPKDREEIGAGIPVTYVPARNTVLLAVALAWAESLDARDIFLGVNARDYSGYPDCRPEYLEAFERLANLATRAGVESPTPAFRIRAPLLTLTKGEIVRKAIELGVDLSLTWSCYDPDPGDVPCGRCDACVLRARGFREAGVEDPALGRDRKGGSGRSG
jgi:7-cyano-7-deazaguanine synthase